MSKNQEKPQSKKPEFEVFVVVGTQGESYYWTKIGAGWEHDDKDGLTVSLTAIPVGGRLVIRKVKSAQG